MERHYTCIACKEPFKVMNEANQPVAPDATVTVKCPIAACQTENVITWPKGTIFFVVPGK